MGIPRATFTIASGNILNTIEADRIGKMISKNVFLNNTKRSPKNKTLFIREENKQVTPIFILSGSLVLLKLVKTNIVNNPTITRDKQQTIKVLNGLAWSIIKPKASPKHWKKLIAPHAIPKTKEVRIPKNMEAIVIGKAEKTMENGPKSIWKIGTQRKDISSANRKEHSTNQRTEYFEFVNSKTPLSSSRNIMR